jgi:hypothetical protein
MPGPPVPFFPPFAQYVLPRQPFEAMIANSGSRMNWLKSHACPCIMNTVIPGSPDPACNSCQGRGVYWDQPLWPFFGLLTFMHMAPSPDEPGVLVDTDFGQISHGEPTLTVPYEVGQAATAAQNNTQHTIWQTMSTDDALVEIDAQERFQTTLVVGQTQVVPYQHSLSIATSGAVTTYDSVNHLSVPVTGYTVSGASVLLPSNFASGTPYTVEFYAAPVWVVFRKAGGLPHVRPFGAPTPVNEPRRFRIQSLDIWLRARASFPNSTSAQSVGAPGM